MQATAPQLHDVPTAAGRRWTWLFVVALLIATATRLQGLSWEALSGDEMATLNSALEPTLAQAAWAHASNPPLYQMALHLWSQAVGSSDGVARLLSAIFGILCVPVAFVFGRMLCGPAAGSLWALLIAAKPRPVWYARHTHSGRRTGPLECLISRDRLVPS